MNRLVEIEAEQVDKIIADEMRELLKYKPRDVSDCEREGEDLLIAAKLILDYYTVT